MNIWDEMVERHGWTPGVEDTQWLPIVTPAQPARHPWFDPDPEPVREVSAWPSPER